jgi:hypothetical protein
VADNLGLFDESIDSYAMELRSIWHATGQDVWADWISIAVAVIHNPRNHQQLLSLINAARAVDHIGSLPYAEVRTVELFAAIGAYILAAEVVTSILSRDAITDPWTGEKILQMLSWSMRPEILELIDESAMTRAQLALPHVIDDSARAEILASLFPGAGKSKC